MRKLLSVLCLILLIPVCLITATEQELALTGPETLFAKENFSLELTTGINDLTQIAFTLAYDGEDLLFYGLDMDGNSDWEFKAIGTRFTITYQGQNAEREVPVLRFKLYNVSEGTAFWVELRDVVVLSGETERELGSVRWDKVVDQPLRGENHLQSLKISDGALSPAFSPSIQNYTANVSYHVGSVDVTAIAQDAYADIEIQNPELKLGGVTDITVTVTAQDGRTRVYTISVTREEDPNRPKSSQCELENLVVTDFLISPEFKPDVTEYVIWLPYEIANVEVIGTPKDHRATVTVEGNKRLLPGRDNLIIITCTAEDGTEKTYTIIAKRAAPHTEPTTEPTQPEPTTLQTQTTEATELPQQENWEPEVPSWTYVVIAVAAITGCAALGILLSDRKK
jgi:hypothetical protein